MKKRKIRKLKYLLEEFFKEYTISGSMHNDMDLVGKEFFFKRMLIRKLELMEK